MTQESVLAKFKAIAEGLYHRTLDNSIVWETFADDQLKTTLGPYSIVLSKQTSRRNELDMVVTVYDELGNQVDRFTDVDVRDVLPTAYVKLKEIYDRAQRDLSGADRILDDVIGMLGSAGSDGEDGD